MNIQYNTHYNTHLKTVRAWAGVGVLGGVCVLECCYLTLVYFPTIQKQTREQSKLIIHGGHGNTNNKFHLLKSSSAISLNEKKNLFFFSVFPVG